MENKFEVCVKVEVKDGRSYINLMVPPSQNLSLEEVGKVLAGGIALVVKSAKNEPEYMKEIMEYLQNEYISLDSFSDSKKFI